MPDQSGSDPHATPPISPGQTGKEHAEERAAAERIGALATLASGVAHEINNPLGYLRANLEYIKSELKKQAIPDPELISALDDAINGADRISSTVSAISLFNDRGAIGPTTVNRLIDTALRMAWPHLGRRASIQKALEPVPEVLANEARLMQVIFQLLVHAADSLAGLAGQHTIWVRSRFDQATNEVIIEVEDDGPGMSPYEARRAFDAAAAVNTRGEWAMGLPLCYRLVSSMGGGMSLISDLNKGRKFRVHLPAVSSSVRPA